MSVLDIETAAYHADQVGTDQPTLSASVAKILLNESPAHAKAAHPRLTDKPQPRDDAKHLELGEAVHSMLLENDHSGIDVCDFPDWRTNAAKEARDLSRDHGRIPMLRHQYDNAIAIAETSRELIGQLATDPIPFTDGAAEQTIVWQEPNGVWCKARIDWLHTGNRMIRDLKTTSRSASPYTTERTIFSMSYDIAEAMYRRGVRTVFGAEPSFEWVFVETEWPHEVSLMALAPDAQALADAKVDRAIAMWAECLESGVWPGYERRCHYVEAPGWAESAWLERTAA